LIPRPAPSSRWLPLPEGTLRTGIGSISLVWSNASVLDVLKEKPHRWRAAGVSSGPYQLVSVAKTKRRHAS
jgi:hypothetical protein